ncbi:MAG TPA: STAS domain-containing protein [Spirochaetota bacterium]|nr:STAS domain-containing protein [Spirochaetota bacterium]HPC42285.1 STAS domain-containing protein [Spirochaetota bacterium]HPL16643.1 STAS domain-containing protein [Spirochaetota bacterium]HQF09991.1 STAS domain-containing protein [Spirochaetota bacterium]HQH98695.1 STAS domain-containing protein [Spirochaetota bacterium]
MNLNIKRVDNVVVVYLAGRLDVHLSAEIEKEINKIIQNEPDMHLLMNLQNVEYMSSSGLRIFVSTMRILKEQKRMLKLCNMNNAVKKIFEVVELMDMFDIYDSEEEALKSFK